MTSGLCRRLLTSMDPLEFQTSAENEYLEVEPAPAMQCTTSDRSHFCHDRFSFFAIRDPHDRKNQWLRHHFRSS
jgi:hypothetical protein